MYELVKSNPPTRGADEMKEIISEQLTKIKAQHEVNILFACEAGSRSYGFASPDSDYDVRFVYVHSPSWYLRVHPGRDVIERTISDGLDISGWELRKALGLLHKSNPSLLEWLRSPVTYRENAPWTSHLRKLSEQYFSCQRSYYHYVSMARNNRAYLAGGQVPYKKYLSTLRPLLAARWLREYGSIPPVCFAELVSHMVTHRALREAIEALMRAKIGGEKPLDDPGFDLTLIRDFIKQEFALADGWKPKPDPIKDCLPLDDYLSAAVQNFGFF